MSVPKSQHSYTLNSSSSYRNHHNLDSQNLLPKIKNSAQNYENYTREVEFRVHNTDDESGSCSPPLWKESTTINHDNLSPNSRTRAIVKGQQELMEMVRNMPESCYELSLRDMVVESPVVENPELEDEKRCLFDEKNFERRKSIKEILKKQDSKKIDKKVEVKSGQLGNEGMFLKMMFPISIGSKKKKNLATNTNKKVSPKVETLGKLPSISEKDWWKKRFKGSSGSESCVTNTSSSSKSTSSSVNSNNSRRSKGWSSGCWSFTFLTKSKRKSK